MTLNPLKHWLEELPNNIFYQIHCSYVVNINCIEKITGSLIRINNKDIPIDRVFKNDFMDVFFDKKGTKH